MTPDNRPRDYQLGPFHYDARVLALTSTYINHQYEMPLVWGLLGNDDELEQDDAEMAAIIEARAVDVHHLVEWRRLQEGRPVCTCGLVMSDPTMLIAPEGHLDQHRWRPVGQVVTRLPGAGAGFRAACQVCRVGEGYDDIADARSWVDSHACPSP